MTLAEKAQEMISQKISLDELVGTKVSVKVLEFEGKEERTIKGNFRQFQSNGNANIYLEKPYKTNKSKTTHWIKVSPYSVEVV